MTNYRRLRLLDEEARRRLALAQVDEPHRREHLEVAEALAWAVRQARKEVRPCKSVILSPLSPRSWRGRYGRRTGSVSAPSR